MKLLRGALVVVLLAIAAAVYLRVGWTRMETVCGSDRRIAEHSSEVSYSWSWNPLGFQCTYGDGGVETSLWF